jgi:hypothetical protein
MRANDSVSTGAVVMVLAVLAGCAAGGAEPAAVRGAKPVAAAGNVATGLNADGEKLRCINEPVTGSRVPQRVCRTEAEWRRLEEASKDYARDVQGPLTAPPQA